MVIRGFKKYRRQARQAGRAAGDQRGAVQAANTGLRQRLVAAKRAVRKTESGTQANWDARVNRAQMRRDAGMRVYNRQLRRVVR